LQWLSHLGNYTFAALVPLLQKHAVHMYKGQHSSPQWQLLCRVHALHGIAAAFLGVLLLLLQTAHWQQYKTLVAALGSDKASGESRRIGFWTHK
jgi:hypothetical protein